MTMIVMESARRNVGGVHAEVLLKRNVGFKPPRTRIYTKENSIEFILFLPCNFVSFVVYAIASWIITRFAPERPMFSIEFRTANILCRNRPLLGNGCYIPALSFEKPSRCASCECLLC